MHTFFSASLSPYTQHISFTFSCSLIHTRIRTRTHTQHTHAYTTVFYGIVTKIWLFKTHAHLHVQVQSSTDISIYYKWKSLSSALIERMRRESCGGRKARHSILGGKKENCPRSMCFTTIKIHFRFFWHVFPIPALFPPRDGRLPFIPLSIFAVLFWHLIKMLID